MNSVLQISVEAEVCIDSRFGDRQEIRINIMHADVDCHCNAHSAMATRSGSHGTCAGPLCMHFTSAVALLVQRTAKSSG